MPTQPPPFSTRPNNNLPALLVRSSPLSPPVAGCGHYTWVCPHLSTRVCLRIQAAKADINLLDEKLVPDWWDFPPFWKSACMFMGCEMHYEPFKSTVFIFTHITAACNFHLFHSHHSPLLHIEGAFSACDWRRESDVSSPPLSSIGTDFVPSPCNLKPTQCARTNTRTATLKKANLSMGAGCQLPPVAPQLWLIIPSFPSLPLSMWLEPL